MAAAVEAGPLLWTRVDLPHGGVEAHFDDKPWSHSWTLEFWWPRPEWLGPVRLSWPDRGVDVVLPVDPAALEDLAAGCPDPPEVTVEAHHPGLDDVTSGPALGLDAHEPRGRARSTGRPPTGGIRQWPHYDPDSATDDSATDDSATDDSATDDPATDELETGEPE